MSVIAEHYRNFLLTEITRPNLRLQVDSPNNPPSGNNGRRLPDSTMANEVYVSSPAHESVVPSSVTTENPPEPSMLFTHEKLPYLFTHASIIIRE